MEVATPGLVSQHIEDIVQLYDDVIEKKWYSQTDFKRFLKEGSQEFLVIGYPDSTAQQPPIAFYHTPLPEKKRATPVDFLEGKIVGEPAGVAVCGVYTQSQLASKLSFRGDGYPRILRNGKRIGLIDLIAVHKKAQQNKIGSILVKHAVELFEYQNCDMIVALVPKNWANYHGIKRILTRSKLRPVREFDNYWMNNSLQDGFHCPRCGPPPCRCTAVLFIRS